MTRCNARVSGDAATFAITEAERKLFRFVDHPEALNFYIALRSALALEHAAGAAFYLPADVLAQRQFFPGRIDRKFYLKMTRELIRLALIERVKPSHFDENGKRRPAVYMFADRPQARADNVVYLTPCRTRLKPTS
jgi:hypothetical protein